MGIVTYPEVKTTMEEEKVYDDEEEEMEEPDSDAQEEASISKAKDEVTNSSGYVAYDDEEEMEEPDSDAPEEESISKAKNEVAEENLSHKKELLSLKKKVKEARRLKHEKNREQQLKKKERIQNLEKCRLPVDLLEAVAKEEQVKVVKPEGKRKVFKEGDFMKSSAPPKKKKMFIPLKSGIKVKSLQQQVKKYESIASKAAEFRQRALYVKTSNRITSKSQRQMLIKQQKAGKNMFVS